MKSRKVFKISRLMKLLTPFLLAGLLLCAVVTIVDINTPPSWIWLASEVLIGILVYSVVTILCINFLFKEYKSTFFSFIKR